ncbi:unnamed protein product [Calypogeia fissa]
MAFSPFYMLWYALALASTAWVLFNFTARFLSRFLGKILKAKVHFRFAGFLRLKDVSIHFTKGPLASVAVREISLKLPLMVLNFCALRQSKLQLCISEVEVLLQKSAKSRQRSVSQQKARVRTKLPGQSKAWPIMAKVAKHVNLRVTELDVKAVWLPNLSVGIGELDLDTFRPEETSLDSLGVRLGIAPANIYVREVQPDSHDTDVLESGMTPDEHHILCSLEHFSVRSNLEYVKDRGLLIHHVEVDCGEAEVRLGEEMLFGDNSLVRSLLRKKVEEKVENAIAIPSEEGQDSEVQSAVEKPAGTGGKGLAVLPDKFSFNLPMVSVNCSRLGGGATLKNKIKGISIRSCVLKPADQTGEIATVCDVHFDCGVIHILEEIDGSLLQILKVSVVATIELYPKVNSRQRVEIDANLEGTRCNLYQNRVDDLLKFVLRLPRNTSKVERVVNRSSTLSKKKKSKSKLCWVCTVSAPEMGVTAYDSIGRPVFTVSSQSLQFFVDNVSGPACRMQLEVGELQVMMIDDLCGEISSSSGCEASSFIRLGGLVMEWGTSEQRFEDDKTVICCSVIILECSQIEIYLTIMRLKALVTLAVGAKAYIKNVFGQKTKATSKSATTSKSKKRGGWRKIEFGVQGLSIQFRGPALIDEGDVVDRKTLNFGDQGGKVVKTHNHDGILRTASIKSSESHLYKDSNILCNATFEEVFGLVSIDDHKKNFQFFLDRGQVSHEQVGFKDKVISKLTMFAVQNFEVLFESGSRETGIPGRLLLSVTNVDGYWDPDVHLFYYDVGLQLAVIGSSLSGKSKVEASVSSNEKQDNAVKKKVASGKQKLRLAVDLEKLNFTAQITKEIDFTVRVQSLVSEDAYIGLLVANIHAAFNDCRVLHVEQAQICRLPSSTPDSVSGPNGAAEKVDWNISIHATKIRTILPFRLQLRVIDDATEDMWRVLKLVMRDQKNKRKPTSSTGGQQKTKKPSAGIQSILVSVHELSFEIEEEPLQGWLDEHYHLMGREVCKLQVRERILEEQRQEAINSPTSSHSTSQEFDLEWEKIHKEAFSDYQSACENLVIQEGSGACRTGRQSGFRVSTNRMALLLVRACNVEMNLSPVTGSMVEAIRKLDCVSSDVQVPYSKVYGRHLSIQASTFVTQLRDFPSPLVRAGLVECEGNVIVAQQATIFPQQMRQEVNLGRLRIVEVWRSISGATPAYKTFFDLDLQVDSGDFSFGVGYEPVMADVSYAFSIALQKAKPAIPVVKKERSLPWWDDMRYYIHGRNSLKVNNFTWSLLATTNPYEDQQMLQFVATTMDITQAEGSVVFRADDFEWVISRCSSSCQSNALSEYQEKLSVLHSPEFKLEILMDWKCESGMPLNHYLHPFPNNLNPPTKKYDLFRSISLSLTFSFSLFCPAVSSWEPNSSLSKSEHFAASKGKFRAKRSSEKFLATHSLGRTASHHSEMPSDALHIPVPTIYFGSQELKWIFRLWNLFYSPPHKLRSFARWPRFGIKRNPRSGNLSLDKVMTEYLLRVDSTPGCIKHRSNLDADPAHGLTFRMKRLRYELLYSRCQSHFESTGPRDPLISVYQGLDLSMLNARLDTVAVPAVKPQDLVGEIDKEDKVKELLGLQEGFIGESVNDGVPVSKQESGKCFLLSMDCFTLRKQAPKAGLSLLSALLHYKRITRSDGSASLATEGIAGESGSDQSLSDASDDEGFNVVLADNCLRVSVYGLKLLWTLPNRDAVWSWVEDFSRAFQSSKPSPSRQYAQRKVLEMKEKWAGEESNKVSQGVKEQAVDTSEEEGVMHFMVNVVQPQFNLHSEDAHGRLLLAAASGRVLARSFHSIVAVGLQVIADALRKEGVPSGPQGGAPVIAWKRRELSVILEHVQAHVAPTDVDLGAGLQWLPKIPTGGAPKVRRTGALLERVFMPCSMYFQYTRHKGGTTDCKVKPLKELSFNSPNITATMTSNQFHIMVDVISNLLLARLPKPRKRPSVQYVGDENSTDEGEEEVDEVVPEGVEEVELARIKLEQSERDCRAVMGHWALMRRLGFGFQSAEIQMLEREFIAMRVERRSAYLTLRDTLQCAAQQRLMEKEKHRTPLAAMRISWAIDKFVWSMLCDGESFAEAEISSMILNVDRDFNDIGVARFTTKWFAVKNCLPGAKSDTVLSPWNPPAEWGRNVMLRVDAKQGAPEDGHSPLELFQVEIYPLKIYLTEAMYTMMWDYLFPEEDHDLVQRQTVRIQHQKVSLSIGNNNPAKEGKNASLTKSVEEKEVEISTDEVSSKANIVRVSNSGHEDLPSIAHIHSTTSIESVKSKEQKTKKSSKQSIQEEKKTAEDKKALRLQKKLLEFHNIRISQVELSVTYEGSRFSVTDMRLLMDTFTRLEFTGSWRRLFSKVKKHIIWSVLKSVTGMQGKKFKDKLPVQNQADGGEGVNDSNSSDSSTSQAGHEDQFPISRFRKHSDRAGEGFVSSIRGLFNSQRRKAKALVMRKLSIDLRNSTESFGYLSGADADSATSPQDFTNLTKAKRLLQRHSRKLRSSGSQKGGNFGLQSQSSSSSSPLHDADLSDGSSTYEEFHELG